MACVVLPSLVLNYLGQGALLLADPKAIENPFFLLYPDWALLPMVVLATVATVIASQAVITGAYSLTRQAIQLGLLPRFEIRHTSETHAGQIYMPRVNMLLLIGVVLLVVMFRSSSALASAYGIAVTGTMVVTTMMAFVVIWKVWRWPPLAAAALIAPFLLIDLTFLAANLLKVVRGRLGAARAWRAGDAADVHVAARQRLLSEKTRQHEIPLIDLVGDAGKEAAAAWPGHGRVPDQRSEQRADRADAQPEALQGAAREERHADDRNRADAAHRAATIGSAWSRSGRRFARHAALRLHGDAEHAEGAGDRPQARLAVRYHVDLVFLVAPRRSSRRRSPACRAGRTTCSSR